MNIKRNLAISDSGYVFDPTTGESFSLNPIATEILFMFKEGKDMNEIKQIQTDRYDVDASVFENDFFDYVNMLKRFNLVENG